MQIAMIGLGKMGANMSRRLLRGGHEVFVYDRNPEAVATLVKEGGKALDGLNAIKTQMKARRAVWIMVPYGDPTESTLAELGNVLEPKDIVIDGGNQFFKDSIRRADMLSKKNIILLDAGTSGGLWGLDNGYCLMVGGDAEAYAHTKSIFETLAPKDGLAYLGSSGAGHFAKMVHNGIEYAMMQAYAEGFELLKAGDYNYDLHQISKIWNRGSVVRSWLLELAERAFEKDPQLSALKAYVDDSGEGRWTVNEAIARAVPVPTIAASLFARFTSRQDNSFAMRVLAALRNEFGGHAVKKA